MSVATIPLANAIHSGKKTMTAMLVNADREFVCATVPAPVRKDGEVLIEIHAAAVNRADLMQREGNYPPPPGWPEWCGLEVAGIVLEAPPSASVRPGEQVCALLGGGGYAEQVAVPAGMVIPIPAGISMVEAATLPEVWSTAYLNLQLEAGGIRPGDTVFIQAGASGVGLAAIQYSKLMGARVITTIDREDKAEFVRKLGADIVVNYLEQEIEPVIAANPIDIALDCVGGARMGECFRHMRFGGRWIMIATMAGAMTQVDLETVFRKRLRIIGSTLRSRTPEEKEAILQALRRNLWPKFSSRELISNIHAVFPLREAGNAHAVLQRCENIGKVVLQVK